ncbi:hypothetical protein Tco_0964831 [Tanacetum coccineum]
MKTYRIANVVCLSKTCQELLEAKGVWGVDLIYPVCLCKKMGGREESTPFTETTLSTQRSPATSGALRRRVMILASGQPIPHGRPYRYHPNGPVHMMTARKRVGSLPTHRLAVRRLVDYSSSNHFTSDYSSRDLSSSSSSETSSDSSSADLPSHDSSSTSPSHKRSRSPTTSVPRPSPIPRALSFARVDLSPPPKRIRSFDFVTDLEDCLDGSYELSVPRETSLRDDVVVRGSDEPHLEHDIDPKIQAEIDECIAYADALRARGIDARVVVESVDRDEIKTGTKGLVKVRVEKVMHPVMPDDIPEPT